MSHGPGDASFAMEPVRALIQEALRWPMRKYFSDEAWEKLQQQRAQISKQAAAEHLQARIALFRAVADLVPEDPASEQAQEITTQWMALGRVETGGEAAIAEAMKKCWEDRGNWTPLLRKSICLGLRMDFATIDRVADFIGKAIDHRMRLDGKSQRGGGPWARRRVPSGSQLVPGGGLEPPRPVKVCGF